MSVRAKFRCMGVTKRWDGQTWAEFSPVTVAAGNTEENRLFWKYTPSGEIKVSYDPDAECPFEPGKAYYVDMVQGDKPAEGEPPFFCERDAGAFHCRLRSVKQVDNGYVHIELGRYEKPSIDITMGIDNPGGSAPFPGNAGKPWAVRMHDAPLGDDEG